MSLWQCTIPGRASHPEHLDRVFNSFYTTKAERFGAWAVDLPVDHRSRMDGRLRAERERDLAALSLASLRRLIRCRRIASGVRLRIRDVADVRV